MTKSELNIQKLLTHLAGIRAYLHVIEGLINDKGQWLSEVAYDNWVEDQVNLFNKLHTIVDENINNLNPNIKR